MNITELNFTDDKEYIDDRNNKWIVCSGDLYNCNETSIIKECSNITRIYTMREISSMDFKEYTDWSKVAVDTKIIYTDNEGSEKKGHFAEVINDTVYVWRNGGTSFTRHGKESVCSARLYIQD